MSVWQGGGDKRKFGNVWSKMSDFYYNNEDFSKTMRLLTLKICRDMFVNSINCLQ
jgi:hypothetical protein